jgi:disulfide bond formation protein DsbB
MDRPTGSTRLPLFVLAASAGALATAFTAQYWGGLHPCVLCLYQRWPYGVAIVLAAIALLVGGRPRGWAVGLAGIAFLVGGGIAAFHVGVEQGWWQGTAQCGATGTANSIDALRAQIMAAPVVRCTDIAWQLGGISMAGFNLLASIVLAAITLLGARRLIREAA